jgi:ABC-type ATPase with predicted acetyltransferase domain
MLKRQRGGPGAWDIAATSIADHAADEVARALDEAADAFAIRAAAITHDNEFGNWLRARAAAIRDGRG